MRIPVSVAWLILGLGFFTSGLLRQFHEATPESPYLSPAIGSLLFGAIFVLLLVAAREWRRGPVPGPGVRLGNLTPLLLMLLLEKWVSLTLYPFLFRAVSNGATEPAILDAQYRGLAGGGLLLVAALVSRFSAPSARKTWRRMRPARWGSGATGTALVVVATYGILWILGAAFGATWHLALSRQGELLAWIIGGQALLALAEEVYFRGLLLAEAERLAPRLGVRGAVGRRWLALGSTSLLFGLEHLHLGDRYDHVGRELLFTIALGLLLGMIVMLSANLHLAAGLHAWINCLLLGAAPRWVDGAGGSPVPSGAYVAIVLLLSFTLVVFQSRSRRPAAAPV